MNTRELLIVSLAALCTMVTTSSSAIEFVPVREYQNAEDSPFADFGPEGGVLIIEDFEDREKPAPGLVLSTNNASRVIEGHSVADREDGAEGSAYEVVSGGACTATFPPQCPTKLTISFDEQSLAQLPTYVGFVWTDAVRRAEEDIHPWIGIDLTNGEGEVASNRILDFPVADTLQSGLDDDTLFSFVDEAGIRSVEVTMMTNGFDGSPRLVVDHVQYGVATLAGDMNLDGQVDFQDFLAFTDEFGNEASSWDEGDFTFDGKTDFLDLLKMTNNFGRELASLDVRRQDTEVAGVPEPSGSHLLLLAAIAFIVCRRSKIV